MDYTIESKGYTFTCSFINKLSQFGKTDVELVVSEASEQVPEKRFWKNYDTEEVSDEFLQSEASSTVEYYISTFE